MSGANYVATYYHLPTRSFRVNITVIVFKHAFLFVGQSNIRIYACNFTYAFEFFISSFRNVRLGVTIIGSRFSFFNFHAEYQIMLQCRKILAL